MAEIVLKNLTKDYRSNEAYKTLRTNIEFSGSDKKVIVFTSCTPNEGKSTVTMGLAASQKAAREYCSWMQTFGNPSWWDGTESQEK